MADLSKILGGPWAPPQEKLVDSPEVQLAQAIRDAGLEPPEQIIFDGKIHRFRTNAKGSSNKGGDRPGWYLVFGDGVPAGRFGCWRSGIEVTWQADVGLHNVINSQSIIRDVECANYCTVRDSRFRKVVSATTLTH